MLYISRFAEDWRFYAALSVGVIFSICVHEFCHAYAALKEGDPTAADKGHLTLNPLKQMGWWSLVMFAFVGIAWGCVPVNPARMRRRWSPAWVAFAGPLANIGLFFLFVCGAFAVYVFGTEESCGRALTALLQIGTMNLVLAVLNLLPVPGLDGWTVLNTFFPRLRTLNSEWINGSFLVLLILVFAGFRYIVALASVLTLLFWYFLGGIFF